MQTKISVVIPTYKRPDLLMRCLQALSEQSIARNWFEVIVVSDGPDPALVIRLRAWSIDSGLNLFILHTEVKKGPAASRNLGWLSARSPLIAFTDDDCIPSKQWLQSFLNHFHGEPLKSFSGRTVVPLPALPTDFAKNTARLEDAEFITANCACTKAALYQTGGFDERFMLAWREDSDLHFKLLNLNIPLVKLEDAVIVHPVREAPWGISIKEQRKSVFEALLFRKYPDLYRERIAIKPLWHYYLINLAWIILLLGLMMQQNTVIFLSAASQTILLSIFLYKRLKGCNKSIKHISEMLFTSILIPTLSLYWRAYGAFKYKVLFF